MRESANPAAIPSGNQAVVSEGRYNTRRGKLTVREHVRRHADLVVYRSFRPYEDMELLVDGSLAPPLDDGVEDQLIAA